MAEECKHGMKSGCSYCHAPARTPPPKQSGQPRVGKRTRAGSVSDKMNDRMTALKRRLKEIRGE
jgi:hypothetical protein